MTEEKKQEPYQRPSMTYVEMETTDGRKMLVPVPGVVDIKSFEDSIKNAVGIKAYRFLTEEEFKASRQSPPKKD